VKNAETKKLIATIENLQTKVSALKLAIKNLNSDLDQQNKQLNKRVDQAIDDSPLDLDFISSLF
jgi:hypothetical protein